MNQSDPNASSLEASIQTVGKVAVISAYANFGGAARAAIRHHHALLGAGINSTMVSLQTDAPSDGTHVVVSSDAPKGSELEQLRAAVNRSTIESNRTGITTTHFSWPMHGVDLTKVPQVRDADTLSIHWISGMMTIAMLEQLASLGKRIVLTLHDEWMYTGGCHYTFGCEGFVSNCQHCPQLISDPLGIPARVLARRADAGTKIKGTIVTPSHWLSTSASRSKAFHTWNHAVIPYALDTDLFKPASKSDAIKELKLDPDRVWVTMVTSDRDERKGGDILVRAAAIASASDTSIRNTLGFLLIGECAIYKHELETLGFQVRVCNRPDDRELVRWYAASTCMVLPTLADNLPNTMLESLSCGRPVIGSKIGGVPDFVKDSETGALFSMGDAQSLAPLLIRAAKDPASFEAMVDTCRAIIESSCDPSIHASAWIRSAASTPVSDEVVVGDDSPIRNGVMRMLTECTLQGLKAVEQSDTSADVIYQIAEQHQTKRAIAQRDELARRLQSAQNTQARDYEESIRAINQLRAELTQNRSLAHKQHETLGTKADQLREHFESKLGELLTKLNESIQSERKANHETRVTQIDLDKARGALALANQLRESVERQLTQAREETDRVRLTNHKLAEQREEAAENFAGARRAHASAKEQAEQLRSRVDTLEAELSDSNSRCNESDTRYEEANRILNQTRDQLSALQSSTSKPLVSRITTSLRWILTGQWAAGKQSGDPS